MDGSDLHVATGEERHLAHSTDNAYIFIPLAGTGTNSSVIGFNLWYVYRFNINILMHTVGVRLSIDYSAMP